MVKDRVSVRFKHSVRLLTEKTNATDKPV